MTERQEPYVTATPMPNYLREAEVMVLSKREWEFIEIWRKNTKAQAVAIEPGMVKLWHALCLLYSQVRRREIEPIVVVDMMRLDAYTLHDVK